jgi:alpha-tubulin suppressor-like RCC1 family protein
MCKHWVVFFVFVVLAIFRGGYVSRADAAVASLADKPFKDSAPRLAVGNSHACHVNFDGTVRCWGENADGQLGTGASHKQLTPIPVANLSDARAITAGSAHTCALLRDGTARCWGENEDGRLGDGTTKDRSIPVTVVGLTDAIAITAGWRHTCALLKNGSVKCWGWNARGALGNGTLTGEPTRVPTAVSELTDAVAINAGASHTCALLKDKTARCWGNNVWGQIGSGQMNQVEKIPVPVAGLNNVIALAPGYDHTCALLQGGRVRCWGRNEFGQLGDGSARSRRSPGAETTLDGAVAITAGMDNACALLKTGSIHCWGENFNGQLGDGTTQRRPTPSPVHGVIGSIAINAGIFNHKCALMKDGTVRCWGRNEDGQLGDGTNQTRLIPITVTTLANSVAVAVGGSHTCALLNDRTVRCWGDNTVGQLGVGTSSAFQMASTTVTGISTGAAVAAGFRHSCALLKEGTVFCWGNNHGGQLGDGTTERRLTPVAVTGLTNIVAISAGGFTCAIVNDGTARCWGGNVYGGLGDGTTETRHTPVSVIGLTNVITITAGNTHACALLKDNTVRCWGDNAFGLLGDGTTERRHTPVAVYGLTNAIAITAGFSHTCALVKDGTALCWGTNRHGELGNGTTSVRANPVPVPVRGLSDAVAISAGFWHTCALLRDGTAQCWGRASEGRGHHNCALLANDAVWCWGDRFRHKQPPTEIRSGQTIRDNPEILPVEIP